MTKQLKEIEIPFGAKDSELCDWEYTIPEGMEATIVDNKIVVKKKDSGDERIRKALLNEFIHLQSKGYKFAGLEGEEIVAWIEKQGEQKPTQEIEPTPIFKIGDILRRKGKDYTFRVDRIQGGYYHCDRNHGAFFPIEEQGNWELVEQKPADKVAPKFKVGDWVVYNRNDHSREVIQIYDIRDNRYYFNDNIHFSWSVKECDEKSHLWTIQDAKDGDVLAVNNDVFIYAHRKQMYSIAVAHCFVDSTGVFHLDGEFGYTEKGNSTQPATKEQCDLLFQKMKEAGYEWDAEKKELKKIEQSPAWSEEDEDMLQSILDEYKSMTTEKRNWLKSLKEKVQPQFTWKPSEHELEVLKLVAEKDGTCLMGLYKQLKKLKEE